MQGVDNDAESNRVRDKIWKGREAGHAQVEHRANFDLGHCRARTRTCWQGDHFAGYATESAKTMTALQTAIGQVKKGVMSITAGFQHFVDLIPNVIDMS